MTYVQLAWTFKQRMKRGLATLKTLGDCKAQLSSQGIGQSSISDWSCVICVVIC